MITAIRDSSGAITAVQRTWLAKDGTGKAPVDEAKMTLGPMSDGAVRFGEPDGTLGLAEGAETALSAKQGYSLPVWAVLGCNRFLTVVIPDRVRTVVIFGDRGEAGWRLANAAADKFEAEGRAVELIMPPTGKDFNDWIKNRGRE